MAFIGQRYIKLEQAQGKATGKYVPGEDWNLFYNAVRTSKVNAAAVVGSYIAGATMEICGSIEIMDVADRFVDATKPPMSEDEARDFRTPFSDTRDLYQIGGVVLAQKVANWQESRV